MIVIRHLDKTFNRGKQNAIHVIDDVSLELPASGLVAIFGRSGCGKTTLLNVIGGLDRVQGGQIEIDGERMTLSSDSLRNRSVGYIFQNYCLNQNENCRENVADALRLLGVSDRAKIEGQVDAALRAVGMERFASRLPDTLSGGQQQRIAIARAIVKNPPIILADEPTGNLDEQNTLHVMRLLKAISRDRLVLLVTHEENLVSAFSDRVIELSDGRIVSDRENTPTEGFTQRDKNTVYLGELPHKTILDGGDGVTLDLWGEPPAPGVKLRLVGTQDGRVYLRIDAGKVSVLDDSSEIRLQEGSAPENAGITNEADAFPDLAAIKPVKGSRAGRLFGFADAWKSGVRANLGKQRRGRKLLRGALILFAAVVVFMTASLGVFVRKLSDVDGTYHHHLVHAYAGDETSAAALAAIGAEAGVIYRQATLLHPSSDRTFTFSVGNFETFSGGGRYFVRDGASVTSSGAALLRTAASSRKLLAGKNVGLGDADVLISEGMARALLKEATVDYLKNPEDLIGVLSYDGEYRIAGVVEGSDREIFLSVPRLLSYGAFCGTPIYLPSELGGIAPPDDGKTFMIVPDGYVVDGALPGNGDSVFINGKTFTVDRVIRGFSETYAAWCEARGYALPSLPDDPGFALSEEYLERYPEYLNEKSDVFGEPDLPTLLWRSGNYPDALYWTDPGDPALIPALKTLAYRALWRGEHPTDADPSEDEMKTWASEKGDAGLTRLYDEKRNDFFLLYSEQFRDPRDGWKTVYGNGFLLNEKEAEAAFSRVGKTTLLNGYYHYDGRSDPTPIGDARISAGTYMTFWSNDPEKTVAAVETALGEHYRALESAENGFIPEWSAPLYTPSDFRREALETQRADIIANAIELAVFLSVMSLCMYLMMRASTMGRIREIGIYRAIGVSKRNLIFRFFVESLAVTSLTVLVGYLFSSVLIAAWLAKVPLIENYFYYPLPMALGTLALLYAIGSLCGTLPVMGLLRKTPSEILSKYDI